MAITLKVCISDPAYVGKAKMGFRGGRVFLNNCKQKAENVNRLEKIGKKPAIYETHFGFSNIGSEMHTFRFIAI